MDTTRKQPAFYLPQGEGFQLSDALGARVRVLAGTVWLTIEGDHRDIVLGAGESWRIDREGLAVMSAERNAEIVIEPRCGARWSLPRLAFPRLETTPLQRLRRRIDNLLHSFGPRHAAHH